MHVCDFMIINLLLGMMKSSNYMVNRLNQWNRLELESQRPHHSIAKLNSSENRVCCVESFESQSWRKCEGDAIYEAATSDPPRCN